MCNSYFFRNIPYTKKGENNQGKFNFFVVVVGHLYEKEGIYVLTTRLSITDCEGRCWKYILAYTKGRGYTATQLNTTKRGG